jgi:hypothetical protein
MSESINSAFSSGVRKRRGRVIALGVWAVSRCFFSALLAMATLYRGRAQEAACFRGGCGIASEGAVVRTQFYSKSAEA